MAERRMFAKKIVESARFLKMPVSSQNLYFHLGMNADDDGVVESYTTMRMLGSSEDDLRVLISKGFVRFLNEDLVTQIMDWKTNNLIKKDRYTPSIYQNLMLQLGDSDSWNPNGTQMEPQVSIGKDSKDKLSKDSRSKKFTPPTLDEVNSYIKEKNLNVDGEKFFNYFNVGNWVDSKGNKVKNWKQKLLTWDNHNIQSPKKPKKEAIPNYDDPMEDFFK